MLPHIHQPYYFAAKSKSTTSHQVQPLRGGGNISPSIEFAYCCCQSNINCCSVAISSSNYAHLSAAWHHRFVNQFGISDMANRPSIGVHQSSPDNNNRTSSLAQASSSTSSASPTLATNHYRCVGVYWRRCSNIINNQPSPSQQPSSSPTAPYRRTGLPSPASPPASPPAHLPPPFNQNHQLDTGNKT